MSDQWAIHADPTSTKKYYVLTHIPSGKRVWSSAKVTTLKMLIQEPEFFEEIDDTSLEDVNKIARAIKRFCDSNTDLTAKPKKKIGWL